MHRSIAVNAPAKINLSLDILGRRYDGYHFMKTLMQTVDLYDTVSLQRREEAGIALSCTEQALPCDETNLAYKAAVRFFAYAEQAGVEGIGEDGLAIEIEKRIPWQAGLAGGSADAAAVLVGLNELYECGFTEEQLCAIGTQIGADVPFCIVGGTLLAEGIGEILTPLPALANCTIVLAKPEHGINTAEAFASYDSAPARERPDTDSLISTIVTGNIAEMAGLMRNVLEPPDDTDTQAIKAVMREFDALGAMMTGSGSAVFGIFDSKRKAAKCLDALERLYPFTAICRPCAGHEVQG